MNFIAEILKTNSFSNTSLLDLLVDVPGHGKVVVDVAYGGAFYAFVSAEKLGLNVCSAKTRDLVAAASAVTEAVKAQVSTDAAATADSETVTGGKARGLQMEDIACKCQTFLSLLSGKRKQTSNIFFLLYTNLKRDKNV